MFLISYICLTLVCTIESARILAVFPTASISHSVVFRSITEELVRRGHQVVVITPDPAFPPEQAPENLTEIDVHDVSYEVWNTLLKATPNNGDETKISEQIYNFMRVSLYAFEKQTEVPEVRDIIKNQNDTFDLLLVEAWIRFPVSFSHVIKAPMVAVSSFGSILDNHYVMGGPTHHLLYPQTFTTRIYNLSFWEKIKQYYNAYKTFNLYKKMEETENVVVRRIFGEDTPPLTELQNNIQMFFLNNHPLWEGNRPVPPGVIHIGGLPEKTEKPLPQELQQYLNASVHGVIYLSFGTNVETSVLPADKIQSIINVFSRLPYDVLWKWNEDELPGRTKNIKISKWFPQYDLLRHPNVKLFITQGGLQSTDETIKTGVPVIGIPMLGDQWYNTEKYEHHKIGKKILFGDLNEEVLESAIKTVIEDKSYRENVVRLRTLMYDKPMTSLERAIWWMEHVIRHGSARHLRSPAHNMHWTEYYELDLVLALLGVVLTAMFILYFVIHKMFKLLMSAVFSKSKRKML